LLKVFFTFDVEVWCGGWDRIDEKFNDAFRTYIYGPTVKGNYGLPMILKTLNDYGLAGIFFVEPLFSLRFGLDPLSEIVGLILDAGQAVELHLHTEWVDEARKPLFPSVNKKRQHLRYFSLAEQIRLIQEGKRLLEKSGKLNAVNAFRAGSFGFNTDTLTALKENQIKVDCSYNGTRMGAGSGFMPNQLVIEPILHNGVFESPMTIYYDRPGHLRHLQLCACSLAEIEGVLWRSLDLGREQVCMLSHNFELLNRNKNKPDPVVFKRFVKLCRFLSNNRDCFSLENYSNYSCKNNINQPEPVVSPLWKTGLRYVEQAMSRYL